MTRVPAALLIGLWLAGGLATGAAAQSGLFERDQSNPFRRDREDTLPGRDRNLPGPLRRTWPYADLPEGPFPAVEARRACHARAVFELGRGAAGTPKAQRPLRSKAVPANRYMVEGHYLAPRDAVVAAANGTPSTTGGQAVTPVIVRCLVSSQQVLSFEVEIGTP